MTAMRVVGRIITSLAMTASATGCHAAPRAVAADDPGSRLRLERKIVLPDVAGRIDHLALNAAQTRLLVAEYANGSVDEIDLASGHVTGRIVGLHEPQGVAYLPGVKEFVVASGDGSVRFYASEDRHEVARLDLGEDADNVRIDARNGHLIVGYGSGGLAVIDPTTHSVLRRLVLPGHPEGFRLTSSRAVVNIPDRGAILAADIDAGRILWSRPTGLHRLNFPLAITPPGEWFAIVYRLPATLALYRTASGDPIGSRPTCGDADDLFLDGDRIYVVCGAGFVEVTTASADGAPAVRVTTAAGARTGLFSPQLGTLFVAAPARGRPAAIWLLTTRASPR